MNDMELLYKMAREHIFSQFLDSEEAKEGIEMALTILMTIA